ncbi:MAG: single-stranded DNA-binding protein [Candidatus Kerfeldbacteria bacterium]|nr:single-stranded DNA-binding protein [Candidatus Kerfeldbacteria bacterium]
MNLNKTQIIGNLAVNPEVRTLPSGQSTAFFRVATSHRWVDVKTKKRQEATEFLPVVAWGRLGEVVGKYLKKGDRVYLDGRLHNRSWEGRDKQKHFRTEIVLENLIMLGGAKKKAGDATTKVNDEVVVEEIDVNKVPVSEKE